MPDKNLTDNEIIKALECCADLPHHNCHAECPYFEKGCDEPLMKDTLDLINRLQAENKNLYKTINNMASSVGKINEKLPLIKAEARKEFAERLKEKVFSCYGKEHTSKGCKTFISEHYFVLADDIDETLKEMGGA